MERTCAVTGGNGYIALALVTRLLADGWSVNTTVRDASDCRKTDPLYALPGAERLRIMSAALGPEGVDAFASCFSGVAVVFHCASPVTLAATDRPEKVIVEPSVEGTKAVLRAVEQCESVKRVVYVSSVAAVLNLNNRAECEGHTFTEDDWNRSSQLGEKGGPYRISKTRAEQAAWAWAKEHCTVKLVSVNPFLVIGRCSTVKAPGVTLNLSVNAVARWLDGSMDTHPPHAYGVVDVDDVVETMVRAATRDEAHGRYLCVGHTMPYAQLMQKLAPFGKVPTKQDGETYNFTVSTAKAEKELGITWTPLEETFAKAQQSLRQNGWLE